MKENIDDIYADIERDFGKSLQQKNAAFALSLIEEHIKNGVLDDRIAQPSLEATAMAIILILERPEIPWSEICKQARMKRVFEYLFIRSQNHYDEIRGFVGQLLTHHIKGFTPRYVGMFMNIFDYVVIQKGPSSFIDEILYPEYAERILNVLHFLIEGERGKGAAIVMACAQEEGLVKDIAYNKVAAEFPSVTKNAYNNYKGNRIEKATRDNIVKTLRSKIGYTHDSDGRIVFLEEVEDTRKSTFLQLWFWLKRLGGIRG